MILRHLPHQNLPLLLTAPYFSLWFYQKFTLYITWRVFTEWLPQRPETRHLVSRSSGWGTQHCWRGASSHLPPVLQTNKLFRQIFGSFTSNKLCNFIRGITTPSCKDGLQVRLCAGMFYTQQTTERCNRTRAVKNVLFNQQVYAKQAHKLER
jgi:hypothetical protein